MRAKVPEMIHWFTGNKYGIVRKKVKGWKKRKRKKQWKTREEKGAEGMSANLAARAEVCPGQVLHPEKDSRAASRASVRVGKR